MWGKYCTNRSVYVQVMNSESCIQTTGRPTTVARGGGYQWSVLIPTVTDHHCSVSHGQERGIKIQIGVCYLITHY